MESNDNTLEQQLALLGLTGTVGKLAGRVIKVKHTEYSNSTRHLHEDKNQKMAKKSRAKNRIHHKRSK